MLPPFNLVQPILYLLGTLESANQQPVSLPTPNLSKDKKQATGLQKENMKKKHQLS